MKLRLLLVLFALSMVATVTVIIFGLNRPSAHDGAQLLSILLALAAIGCGWAIPTLINSERHHQS
jgi:uncharacterized membrane protein YqjE